jgi:phosphoglycolate phosphatase
MSPPLGLVVFDVDGTLVDSRAHILASMAAAFADLGLAAPTREAVLHCVGLSLPEVMAQLTPDQGEDIRLALVERYKSHSVQRHTAHGSSASSMFFPGMRAVLDRLKLEPYILMAVATGMSRRGLDRIISQNGLEGYFHATQVADHHPSKPNPAMLHAALSETGIEATHAVMVGDTIYDIQMGQAAGASTIGVTWGNHGAAQLSGADHIVDSPDDLHVALKNWMEDLT